MIPQAWWDRQRRQRADRMREEAMRLLEEADRIAPLPEAEKTPKPSRAARPGETMATRAEVIESGLRSLANVAEADAVEAATRRVQTILASPLAGGECRALAEHLAFNTTESVDSALRILRMASRNARSGDPGGFARFCRANGISLPGSNEQTAGAHKGPQSVSEIDAAAIFESRRQSVQRARAMQADTAA